MRIRAALFSAALAVTPLAAQDVPLPPQTEDARAVIGAVLAHEAAVRGSEGGAETCVARALAGPPAAPGSEEAMVPDRAVRILFQWHEPPPPAVVRPVRDPDSLERRRPRRPDPVPPPAALAPASAERLNGLRAEAARAAAPSGLAQIDSASVPAPLHLQRPNDDCALLSLSAPAFAGDAAFVAVDYACGPICGNGGLYAVERRDGRWQVVAIADIWIR